MPDRERTATGISEKAAKLIGDFENQVVEFHTEKNPMWDCHNSHHAKRVSDALESYIASLEADRDRLDVLEEMMRADRLAITGVAVFESGGDADPANSYPTFREAADAELRRRDAR